ncbi:MAG: hypothetical protein Q8Q15_02230 [bacterium]|nr:hypothetical protein [bacterium]
MIDFKLFGASLYVIGDLYRATTRNEVLEVADYALFTFSLSDDLLPEIVLSISLILWHKLLCVYLWLRSTIGVYEAA